MNNLKTGIYNVDDGKFSHRYLVYKIMPKTVEVSVGISYQGSDFNYTRCYRYPKELLIEQIKKARYCQFEKES